MSYRIENRYGARVGGLWQQGRKRKNVLDVWVPHRRRRQRGRRVLGLHSSIAPVAIVVFGVIVGAMPTMRATAMPMAMAVDTMVAVARRMMMVTAGTGWPVLNKNIRSSDRTRDVLGGGGCAIRVSRCVAGHRISGLLWLLSIHG